MFMSAQIIYYMADTGLAAFVISAWRCWPSQHIFRFAPLQRRCRANCRINCPRVRLITCGSCLEISRVWCKAAAHKFPWTLQCPQKHLELVVTSNHQAFSCDSAGTGGLRRACVVTCFLWLDLWMKWEGMPSDPEHCSETMNGFKSYGRRLIAF